MLTDKQMDKFCRKWNGWGIVVLWLVIALFAVPLPFIIDFLVREVFQIL